MAFDLDLDARIQAVVEKDLMVRKKMFGGTCYMYREKMVCGVWRDFLILKVGESRAQEALRQGQARPFDITGKPMKGWVMFPKELASLEFLESWIGTAKSRVDDSQ